MLFENDNFGIFMQTAAWFGWRALIIGAWGITAVEESWIWQVQALMQREEGHTWLTAGTCLKENVTGSRWQSVGTGPLTASVEDPAVLFKRLVSVIPNG